MKTTMDVLSQIREQTLEYVRAGHEAAVEATRSFYESLGQLVPDDARLLRESRRGNEEHRQQ